MKLAKLILFVASCCLWQEQLKAETLEVEYASFYSHVKKLDDPDTNALRFAFGFQHIAEQRLCKVSKAQIITQKQTLEVDLQKEGILTV